MSANNISAFPKSGSWNEGQPSEYDNLPQDGMTLRDYFAAKASDNDINCALEFNNLSQTPANRAEARYLHANAMLGIRQRN